MEVFVLNNNMVFLLEIYILFLPYWSIKSTNILKFALFDTNYYIFALF
jgi:hypothetical protein